VRRLRPSLETREATLAVVRMECFAADANGTPRHAGSFPRFVDSLAPYFREIEVAVPRVPPDRIPPEGSTFSAPNVRLVPLPDLQGVRRCYGRAPSALARLWRRARRWDLINLRVPDNFFPFGVALARARRIPYYVSLVADPLATRSSRIASLPPLRRPLARLHGALQQAAFRRGLTGAFCVAHGEALRRVAESSGALAQSLLSASLWDREILLVPPPPGPGNRLLYVGRISPEKGLGILLEAVARASRKDFRLTLVGAPFKGEDRILKDVARRDGLSERLSFLGHVPLGPRLFRIYQEHDLLVLPSLSEGTPRVLGEAMGNGIAIVASDAGGVRDLIEHDRTGHLVPPGDSASLSGALDALSADAARRSRFVAEGLRVARGRTLEAQARRHFEILCEARGTLPWERVGTHHLTSALAPEKGSHTPSIPITHSKKTLCDRFQHGCGAES